MAIDKKTQDLQDQEQADAIIDKIDREVENNDIGHEAVNGVKYARNFNTNLLENSIFAHDDKFLEDNVTNVDDSSSTFDEENYVLGNEEYYKDAK